MNKLTEEEGIVGPRRFGGQEMWIERTALPAFDSNHMNRMDFRRVFKDLPMNIDIVPVIELAQLRSKLPEDAKKLITGIKKPAEAWKLLDKRYGYRHMLILSVINKNSVGQLAPRTYA